MEREIWDSRSGEMVLELLVETSEESALKCCTIPPGLSGINPKLNGIINNRCGPLVETEKSGHGLTTLNRGVKHASQMQLQMDVQLSRHP